jgi:hypothetical protein
VADAGLDPSYGPNMAAMYGIYTYRATRDWARWAGEQLGRGSA